MAIGHGVLFGTVMHRRLFPKDNLFTYGIYYIGIKLEEMATLPLPRRKFSALSFMEKDHGARDASNLKSWALDILTRHGMGEAGHSITLICMPRVWGYVFNPVSFWLCWDTGGHLLAVLCEVNNTFGETHTYLCAHPDKRPIAPQDILKAQKLFHVSPLLKREGHYTFRFESDDRRFSALIDYYDGAGNKELVTSLKGVWEEMTPATLKKALWSYPLITLKAITLIHWQAVKLLLKGVAYIRRPQQNQEKQSATENLTKL